MRNLLLVLVLGCTIQASEPRRTPYFKFTGTVPDEYREAIKLVDRYGNSDEFYNYMLKKRTYLAHTRHSVMQAIRLFRGQLEESASIEVVFVTSEVKEFIGGWSGKVLKENIDYKLPAAYRAGHLLHEASHKYGWVHKGNDRFMYDNLNSFSYALSIDFPEFIIKEVKYE